MHTKIEFAIGAAIAGRRQELGMTQIELGTAVGHLLETGPWARQTVWNCERGKRAFAIRELYAIAEALECSVAQLLPDPGDPLPSYDVTRTMAKRMLQAMIEQL